jgi:flavodoxin
MAETVKAKKALVVYYSFEGNTRMIAEAVAAELGADIQELKPLKDIRSKGFGKYVWGGRQVLSGKEPELSPLEHRPDDYDAIFIGSPVWVYTFAPALRTFFKQCPLKGKRIGIFLCHGGGPKEAMARTEAMLAGNTIIGRIDFEEPLKNDPEAGKRKARSWARECLGA